jgi:hypothetical protein
MPWKRFRGLCLCIPVLLPAALCDAAAQPRPSAATFTATCPPTLTVTYSAIAQRGTGDPEDNLSGFTASFTPDTVVRLIVAAVGQRSGPGEGINADEPENGETVRPGQPLIYRFWDERARRPLYPAAIKCGYEGGFAMQQPVPANMRSCALLETRQEPTQTGTTARSIITRAAFTCR